MNHRERFHAIMSYELFDRLPVWFFGTWRETKACWKRKGLDEIELTASSSGPQLAEMDPDWESGIWKVDDLLPLWLDSGIDIVFPIEVGTWNADPVTLRTRYGKRLRMMGGVDKHVIPHGEDSIRAHLMHRKALAAEGGYIPFPDHRIPPDCSLEQFRTYLRVFREVYEFEAPC